MLENQCTNDNQEQEGATRALRTTNKQQTCMERKTIAISTPYACWLTPTNLHEATLRLDLHRGSNVAVRVNRTLTSDGTFRNREDASAQPGGTHLSTGDNIAVADYCAQSTECVHAPCAMHCTGRARMRGQRERCADFVKFNALQMSSLLNDKYPQTSECLAASRKTRKWASLNSGLPLWPESPNCGFCFCWLPNLGYFARIKYGI